MPTVKETFDQVSSSFRPQKAVGLEGTVQYEISGEGGGVWHVAVKGGACAVRSGPAPAAGATLSATAQVWLEMFSGKLSGEQAFASGRITVKGDAALLARIEAAFQS